MFYEDVQIDPKKELDKLNEFMELTLSDQQIQNVCY